MKLVKFKSYLLKKDWVDILEYFNLVDKENRLAFPSKLYMSKEDIKIIRKNMKLKFKKQYPNNSKKSIEYYESLEYLNYGANSSLEDGIKKGYALVNNDKGNKK